MKFLYSTFGVAFFVVLVLLGISLIIRQIVKIKLRNNVKSGFQTELNEVIKELKKLHVPLKGESINGLKSTQVYHNEDLLEVWPKLSFQAQEQLLSFWTTEGIMDNCIKALGAKVESERVAATRFLIQIKNKQTVVPLIQALGNPQDYLPARVAEVLMSYGDEAVEEMVAFLPDLAEETKCLVISILEEMGSEKSIPVLLKELVSSSAEVRQRAASALGEIGNPDAVDFLMPLMTDSDWKVKANAAKALGKLGLSKAVPVLKEALDDEAWWVRTNAQEAIERLNQSGR